MTTMPEPLQDSLKEVKEAISNANKEQLQIFFSELSSSETARVISRLSTENQTSLFTILEPKESAEIIAEIPQIEAANVLGELPPGQAAPIIDGMRSDHQVDLLNILSEKSANAILDEMPVKGAEGIKQLMSYPGDTAGGLMITEYLAYPDHLKVGEVLDIFREKGEQYVDYAIQYTYVISESGELLGVLRLRDLILSSKTKRIKEVMILNPLKISVHSSLKELQNFFSQHQFLGVPITDDKNILVGIVRRASVEEAANKRASQIFLKINGIIGGEEFRSMPLFSRSSRRLSWLSLNIVLNIIAASVIAFYQDTLEKVIILAVFLPIISDMSGCSGNQAVAISMRELTLGLVRPREIWRVFYKEAIVGIINGIVLGCLLGGAAFLWKGNPYLGVVVGGALAINTLVAVCLGGAIPLFLRRLNVDPALASGPLLTTITDMCGFFFVLSFASVVLPRLIG